MRSLNGAAMDKVHPERNTGWTQAPSKSAAIKEKWNNYVESATLHGLQHIFTSRAILRRILWAFFLLISIGHFSFQCTLLIKKYFSYPVNTKVTLEYETSCEFPAVTICNFNMLRQSKVDENNFGDVAKYAHRNKIDGLEVNPSEMDWSQYKDLNFSNVYAIGGHQMEDMITECSWIGEKCTYRNLTTILTSMGLCHTFNSGQGGRQILKVNNAGANFGLRLVLNMQQYDYYGLVTKQAGLKVLIHDHETPPMVDQLGFAVGPGTSTFAAVRKEKVRNLKWPYESNCTASLITDLPGYTRYTTSACLLTCHSRYLVKKCGCRDAKLPVVENAKECGFSQTANCIFPENDNFYKKVGNKCNCSVPCMTINLKPVLSYASFPSEKYVLELMNINVGNASDEKKLKYRNWVSQNILELNVYFQELNVLVIKQQPAYGAESLLGELGGQLGLCIGASLLTLLEFCDVIFSIITVRLGCAGKDSG